MIDKTQSAFVNHHSSIAALFHFVIPSGFVIIGVMPHGTFRQPHSPWVSPGGIDCQAADLTATISGEMTLKEAQHRLGEFDQWIPIDGDEDRPIGFLVEENSSGPLRLGYGAWRDLLLGCQFRSASGKLITAGGRTMKNVAGYDLTKFMVGQRGVFGKIITITTRTYKRPAGALAARFMVSDQWVSKIIATSIRPRWTVLSADTLWCGWLDGETALAFYQREAAGYSSLEFFRQSLEADIALRRRFWGGQKNSFRASVPPTRILEFVVEGKLLDWSADAAFGIVVGSMEGLDQELLIRAAEKVGGSIFVAGDSSFARANEGESAVLRRLLKGFAL